MLTSILCKLRDRLHKRWQIHFLFVTTALITALAGLLLAATVSSATLSPVALADEGTAFNRTSSAYEEALPNMGQQATADHDLGDEAFEEAFVLTPGLKNSGLGPAFNNTSCVSCHIKNGRGMPEAGQLLLRVSGPGDVVGASGTEADLQQLSDDAAKGSLAMSELGNQIQDFGVAGHQPEATVEISWKAQAGRYADGTAYELRSPAFDITLANGEPLPKSTQISPRIPPHVYGTGLLEAIPQADILALADAEDRDRDGISGRPNWVFDVQQQEKALGRFGWKASSPNLLQQSAEAYLNDMGITNPLFPAEDGTTEIDEATLVAAAAYAQTLAVPARGMVTAPEVQRGEKLFADASCTACHVSGFKTGEHKYPSLVNQTIYPYTDMLLHDMGKGLADNRPDFEATGQEWRTPALWGVGLAQTVLPYSGYLHDGRARTFEEAILWHGGEAEVSKVAFERMAAEDRAALVQFLQSL